ncbi:hypothetical protein DL98DRAFT_581790 [Cadophora sp. DSE1049]|nr:hypothetical protein DL98DRAFT_581790 [Cadophora sp. DSE1049]
MAYRNESLQGQAVSTEGMSIWQLDRMGDFVKFAEMPIELQDQVWEEYVGDASEDVKARDVHVKIVLEPLFKESLWFKLKSKLKKNKHEHDNANEDTTPKYTISVVYASHSAPPPTAYLVQSRVRTLAFAHLPHKPAIPLPNTTNFGTITKLIPISFTSSDTLTITFPFGSEIFLEFLLTHLCPMINKYVRPPAELTPPGWGRDIRVGGSMCDRGDTRVLKGAGAVVWKRMWLKGGKKEGRSVLAFKMCEMADGLDVDVQGAFGGRRKARGWKVEHRLRGVPIGSWDAMWLRLMECLEVKGEEVEIDDLFV